MLDEWLTWKSRTGRPPNQFGVLDIKEINVPKPEIVEYLAQMLRDCLVDPAFLADASEWLDWPEITLWATASVPPTHNITLRRGSFGEALATAMVEQFHGYNVPIRKLRYRMSDGQTLPGTDIVALAWTPEAGIKDLCFIEVKLRTTAAFANDTVTGAYAQLLSDRLEAHPVMLSFIAQRLREQGHPLYPLLMAYLRDRRELVDTDSYRIILIWDSDAWSETTLENLEELEIEVKPLTVHITEITQLPELVDHIYATVPCICEPVDDD